MSETAPSVENQLSSVINGKGNKLSGEGKAPSGQENVGVNIQHHRTDNKSAKAEIDSRLEQQNTRSNRPDSPYPSAGVNMPSPRSSALSMESLLLRLGEHDPLEASELSEKTDGRSIDQSTPYVEISPTEKRLERIFTLRTNADGEQETKNAEIVRVQNVLQTITDNPTLLQEMPPLSEDRQYGKDVDYDVLDSWAQKVGLEYAFQAEISIPYDVLSTIMTCSPRLAEYIHLEEAGSVSLPHLLELMQFLDDEQRITNEAFVRAQERLTTFLPGEFSEVREPVAIIPTYGDHGNELSNSYLGKVNGTHVITLGQSSGKNIFLPHTNIVRYNPYRDGNPIDLPQESVTNSATHELVHMLHAQLVGDIGIDHYPYMDSGINPSKIRHMSPAESSEMFQREANGVSREHSTEEKSNIAQVIQEGVAVGVELYILDALIKKAQEQNDQESLREYKRLKKARLQYIAHAKKADDYVGGGSNVYSIGLLEVFPALLKRFGKEKLPQVLQQINMRRCTEILEGSDEFERILGDITLLPGLTEASL